MEAKRIKGQEDYDITNDGRVISWKWGRQKVLKPSKRNGYNYISLSNGVGLKTYIHRLVAESFIPNPDNLPCINHKDGDKLNNNVENLEWCTYSHNNQHAFDNGLKKMGRGTKSHLAKFTKEQVIEIREIYDAGGHSHKSLGEIYGFATRTIGEMIARRTYKDVE